MRNKWGRIALAMLLAVTIIGSGCSTNWVQQAQEIVAVLMPAITNLVILVATLQGKEISAEDVAVVQKAGSEVGGDLRLILSLIAAYESADQKAKPGILSQIQNAIQAAQENLQGVTQGLHIKDGATQARVAAIVGVLLAEVQSLAAILPVIEGQAQGQRSGARGQGAEARVQNTGTGGHEAEVPFKRPLSASEFVKSYNAIMTTKTGRAELDQVSSGLQLHSKEVSAGVE